MFSGQDSFVNCFLMHSIILFALSPINAISSEVDDDYVKLINTILVYKLLSSNRQNSLFNKNHIFGNGLQNNDLYLVLNSSLLDVDTTAMIKHRKSDSDIVDLDILRMSKYFDLNNNFTLLLGRDILSWDISYGSSIFPFF